jgi:transposase InsO family protein
LRSSASSRAIRSKTVATSVCTSPSKKEATRPPGFNSLQQQDRFDAFVHEFNCERPHEALDMKCPAERYTASLRAYGGLPELS